MRSDKSLDDAFVGSDVWTIDLAAGEPLRFIETIDRSLPSKGDNIIVHSHSGNERNHVFMNEGGERFHDVSSVSGANAAADGRAFATCDFDRDGRVDLALTNANSPLLTLYRNKTSEIGSGGGPKGNFIAVRLTGGNHSSTPSSEWSNRDGVGSVITVTVGDRTLMRAQSCGEGFAAQNSRTLVIGIGDVTEADRVTVRWPSGKLHHVSLVETGTLLLVDEAAGIVSPVPYNPTEG